MADPVTTPTTAAERLAESGWSAVHQRQQGVFELECTAAECRAKETIHAELPARFPAHRCKAIGRTVWGAQPSATPTPDTTATKEG